MRMMRQLLRRIQLAGFLPLDKSKPGAKSCIHDPEPVIAHTVTVQAECLTYEVIADWFQPT